ncbi:MAG TPA: tetrahydrofolate dehydrogenase/cyclohydrolase catalytic domain-containing protein, partial [Elusimicrobiales bacterium]|nr:tetrahydrofolate dehydrogenase/cyclohydrolase catalytic domain-containing protein [Elusimicrobiales bacterium]
MPRLLEGKTLAAQIRANLQDRVAQIRMEAGRAPQLAAIASQENDAAAIYLNKEMEACRKIGIDCRAYPVDGKTYLGDFTSLLKNISASQLIDAVLIPRPLPGKLEQAPICDLVTPEKDIDGVSTYNMGRLFLCKEFKEIAQTGIFVPCTALAVVKLLRFHEVG